MIDDSERREVARRLRRAWTNVPDRNPVRHHMRVLFAIYEAVGISDGEGDAIDLFDRLADLIDPDTTTDTTKTPTDTTKRDRGALLELADEMDKWALTCDHYDRQVSPLDVTKYARRIREALGVSDG